MWLQGGGRVRRERKQVQRWADDPLATVDLGGSSEKREAVFSGNLDHRGQATNVDPNWVPPKNWKGGIQHREKEEFDRKKEVEAADKVKRQEDRELAKLARTVDRAWLQALVAPLFLTLWSDFIGVVSDNGR